MIQSMFLPANQSLMNLDVLKSQGQGLKDWLAEDSVSKSALVNTLALAGPKGYLIAKGIEVASLAVKHLGGSRKEVTGAYAQASENEPSALGRMKDTDAIMQAQQGQSSRHAENEKMRAVP